MADVVTTVGTVASVVAAVGVAWERLHWWRNRPRTALAMDGRPHPMAMLNKGPWQARITNAGTEEVRGVHLLAVGCTTNPEPAEGKAIPPRSHVVFDVDVDDEDLPLAWVLITWTTPSNRRRDYATWFPLQPEGELGRVRERQLGRLAVLRRAALIANAQLPSPVSSAVGRAPFGMQQVGRQVPRRPRRLLPTWIRRSVVKLFRVVPEPVAEAAMGLQPFPKWPGR